MDNKKYIIGNWKSNKSLNEVQQWFDQFSKLANQNKNTDISGLEIIILPPLVYLESAKKLAEQYRIPMKIGAQDISPFSMGAYTGEVNGLQLAQFCEYVLIGHSERRKYFHEDDELLGKKVIEAEKANLKTIYCVPDSKTSIPATVSMVAYEPVWAIGTGQAESPEKADETAGIIKQEKKIKTVIYGGSVMPDNIADFLERKQIDGVLPGGASLDPNIFWQIIIHAAS